MLIKTYELYTDPVLVALWQQGDEKAFNSLYDRYVVYLTNIALKKTSSIETAKDCVQEVFVSVYYRRDFLQPSSSLKAYLFKALQNKIYNFHLKELTRMEYEEIAAGQIDNAVNDVFENIHNKELKASIESAINQLPPQCKKIFLMSREEQLPYKEIAAQLNISVNTVDQHIQKALRKLRVSLKLLLFCFLYF